MHTAPRMYPWAVNIQTKLIVTSFFFCQKDEDWTIIVKPC